MHTTLYTSRRRHSPDSSVHADIASECGQAPLQEMGIDGRQAVAMIDNNGPAITRVGLRALVRWVTKESIIVSCKDHLPGFHREHSRVIGIEIHRPLIPGADTVIPLTAAKPTDGPITTKRRDGTTDSQLG